MILDQHQICNTLYRLDLNEKMRSNYTQEQEDELIHKFYYDRGYQCGIKNLYEIFKAEEPLGSSKGGWKIKHITRQIN